MNVLVLGANGFIGSHLTRAILHHTAWTVHGLDREDHRVAPWLGHCRFRFHQADIADSDNWINQQAREADVCLPLVATVTPASYVREPLATFELDFEHNLRVVRLCAEHKTRVIFPSSSEVYGMCPDEEFDEETSPLVYGPVDQSRWIYGCAKQLLDRVITAMGAQCGLRYTLFRPFNWIGPGQDSIHTAAEGSSRVLPQILGHLLRREPITLVDGGQQRRCFTYIDDGIDALLRILESTDPRVNAQIFNLGNPANDWSIKELVNAAIQILATFPGYRDVPVKAEIIHQPGDRYYGRGYEDVSRRVPAIERARRLLGWNPQVGMDEALHRTIAHYAAQ
ncbi:MAG: bifunctional UDP-4-keto-pentose/UDP-xylose synthase [Pseudonocardiaceae bacterium]